MTLNFKSWLIEKLGGGQERAPSGEFNKELYELVGETYVRELAFWSCVNLIANAISKCEFKTYYQGQEEKAEEYYRWNMQPNLNQSKSTFIHKLIAQLYRRNEALVIEQNGQLLVADAFCRKPYALYDDVFTQVQVNDFSFSRSFVQSDVLYFQLSSRNMKQITDGMYEAYRKMISCGMKHYGRARGNRAIVDVAAPKIGDDEAMKKFNDLIQESYKPFLLSENGILPLTKGYTYTELDRKAETENSRDIRAMINDVSDFTAKAFQIPPALVSGELQGISDALDQFLTFCIDPLAEMIGEEINRKRYGYKDFKNQSYLQVDTKPIKHIDPLGMATSVDKLISSGAYTINMVLDLFGEPRIKEPWADQHFMTKNYSTIAELLNELVKGGEKNEA